MRFENSKENQADSVETLITFYKLSDSSGIRPQLQPGSDKASYGLQRRRKQQ